MKKKYVYNIAVFIIIVAIALIYANFKESKLEKNGQFTIGKIENIFWAKGGMSCSYTYFVNDKAYKAKSYIYENDVAIGEFYYVKYDKNLPKNSEIIFDKKAKGYNVLKSP